MTEQPTRSGRGTPALSRATSPAPFLNVSTLDDVLSWHERDSDVFIPNVNNTIYNCHGKPVYMQGKRVLVERLTMGDIVKYYHIPLNVITKPVPLMSWDPLTKVAYAFWVQGRNQWKDLDTRNLVSPSVTSDELVLMHKQAQEEVDEEERRRTTMAVEETNTLGIRFAEEIPLPEFPFHYVSHTTTPATHETSLSPDHTPTDKGKGVEQIGSYQMGPSTSTIPQYACAMMTSPQTQTATVATGGGGGRLKVERNTRSLWTEWTCSCLSTRISSVPPRRRSPGS